MEKKVWLITGSSRGFGRALANAVLKSGNQLIATARNPDQLKELEEIYGDQVKVVKLDVNDELAAMNAVQLAVDTFGKLDVLVNNAGYGNVNAIEDTTMQEFREQIDTNLFGTINLTKAVLPVMREQGFGHIIQFSSVGGRLGPVGRAPYAAAKWAVEGFSEVLAKEVNPLGIKVTIIEPGGFRTDFAGVSTVLQEVRPEYDATVGAMARFQAQYDGKQPGDPAKGADVILQVVDMDEPPLRLLLGSDAVNAVEKNDLVKMESDLKWRQLSISTDF